MSRNEIRLRRQRLTGSGASRFRNYSDILQRHEREVRIRKVVRVFTMMAIAAALIILLYIVIRWEERINKSGKVNTTGYLQVDTHSDVSHKSLHNQ